MWLIQSSTEKKIEHLHLENLRLIGNTVGTMRRLRLGRCCPARSTATGSGPVRLTGVSRRCVVFSDVHATFYLRAPSGTEGFLKISFYLFSKVRMTLLDSSGEMKGNTESVHVAEGRKTRVRDYGSCPYPQSWSLTM